MGGKARVVSTFYDVAGRPYLTTKPFIDKASNPNTIFTPGDFNEINSTLNNDDNYSGFITFGTNAYAYSETEYFDNPLGQVKRAGAPWCMIILRLITLLHHGRLVLLPIQFL